MNCPSCDNDVEPPWRFCTRCGTDLHGGDTSDTAYEVTVVVSDLQGSTALAERLDPEVLRDVLDRYFDELGRVLESYGGRIEKRIGDAMVTVFGVPAARADDALLAVQAVAECQATLANLNDRLERTWGVRLTNRTGVSTGSVIFSDAGAGHRVIAGEALEVAMALEPVAPPLEALLDASTVDAIGAMATTEPVTEHRLKNGSLRKAARLISVAGAEEADRSVDDHAPDRCGTCGALVDVHAVPPWRWCFECASPVGGQAIREASRRTLTILFADLRPALDTSNDPDARRIAMVRAFEALRPVLERHGATVEKFIGDAVMAVFGLAQRREDDALRAVRAALDMHEALERVSPALEHDLGVRLELRIGVNTGPVIAGGPGLEQRLVTGDAVNVAARLEQTARVGDVVIGAMTRRLVGEGVAVMALEPLTLKGKADPVPAFRVERITSGGTTHARLELPFAGRDRELDALLQGFGSTLATGACRRITIRGDAGIGKSRLVYELIDRLPESVAVLRGSCLAYGEGITFWPVIELIQTAAGISLTDHGDAARSAIASLLPDAGVVERLWSLAGLTDRQFPVAELSWAVRRLIGHLGRARPLVVVVDGLQWAEPTLLDLLDELHRNLRDAPVLLVTMERPADDDRDDPSGTTAVTSADDIVDVEPLDDTVAGEVIATAVGRAALPAALIERVKRAAAGNPLFIEQFLTMLIDDGILRATDGTWTVSGDIEHMSVPPTIEAVLAARIDAVGDDERGILEPASVIGREFSRTAVDSLIETSLDSDGALAALIRRQMVVRARDPDVLVDYRFRNLLLREVVYDGLLKRTRASLHQRFAEWLERFADRAERTTELQEILGHHLEQAYHLRSGLGAMDEDAIALGRRAADRLAPAGLRAFARGDMPAAANLLARAARTLPDAEPTRPRLLARAAEARMETGGFPESIALYDEAEADGRRSDDLVAAGIAELGRVRLRYLTGDGITEADARLVIQRLTPIFENAGDHRAQAGCHRLLFNIELTHGRWDAAGAAAKAMIDQARLAGDRSMEQRGLPALAGVAMYGPTPVPVAIERCQAVLAQAGDDRMVRALTERAMANLLAFEGRFDEARRMCRATREQLLELGWHFDAALVSLNLGPIEMLAGRPDEAVRELRGDYETLRAMGEQNYISTTAAYLAEAVRQTGDDEAALAFASESASIAAEDDIYTQALWRATRARALTSPADAEEAERLIGEAVSIALGTDDPTVQADLMLAQAEVLIRVGSVDRARASVEAALARYRAKQHRVGERQALDALQAIPT